MNNLQNMQNQNFNSSYEQKNDKKGIFYGVVAVATLVVAVIGATFAYFTASANSSEGALSAVAAHVQVNYTQGKEIIATNLIPASAQVVQKAYAQKSAYEQNIENGCTYSGAVEGTEEKDPESVTVSSSWSNCTPGKSAVSTGNANTKCVDDNGYYVCFVYQFDVTNTSNVSQSLSSYLTITDNTFTTVDTAALTGMSEITQAAADAATDSNRALKFMTVRSDSIIDTEVRSCAESVDLYDGISTSQSKKSTAFCKSNGTDYDVTASGSPFNRVIGGNSALSTESEFTDADHTFYYFYFNTTATRQPLQKTGTQYAFQNELIPSVPADHTTVSNGLLYMHTDSSVANQNYTVGTSASSTTLNSVYADGYGNSFVGDDDDAASAACIAAAGTRYITADANIHGPQAKLADTCEKVYLSTNSTVADGSSDVIKGVYGQVRKTFYIVAWLEENNTANTFAEALKDEGGVPTGTTVKIHQDADQDARFSATINVTSGSEGQTGITGTIADKS